MLRFLLDRWRTKKGKAASASPSDILREKIPADAILGHPRTWPVHPVAILVGLAVGWQWSGMKMILTSVLGPAPTVGPMWAALVFLMMGLGPWLPERIVLRIAAFRRFRAGPDKAKSDDRTGAEWILQAVRERDESLTWLTFAFLTGAAGVLSLIILAASGVFAQLYEWLTLRFFWTGLTLTLLDWVSVTLLVGLPWVLNGLIVAVLPPVIGSRQRHHCDPPGVSASLLVGLGLACWCHEVWADHGLSGEQVYVVGVLPMFMLAAVSAKWSQHVATRRSTSKEEEMVPEVRPEGEGLIWMSLVVWGIAAVWAGWGWLACIRATASDAAATQRGGSWYVLLIGLGIAVASFQMRRRNQSASGCGMATCAAGIGLGLAATLMARWSLAWPGTSFCLLLMALPLGYALHYCESAWLARVGSETLGFAFCISAVLGGATVGVILAYWWALPTLGAMGLLCIGSLSMLAFGGLVQVYEQDRALRIREQRLALVFASLACAIALFPGNARRWGRMEQSASSLNSARSTMPVLTGANRICLIGVQPDAVELASALSTVRVDLLQDLREGEQRPPAKVLDPRVKLIDLDAVRALCLTRQRYDLVYHRNRSVPGTSRFAAYSFEWFERLARHATSGGQVIVDVPLTGLNVQAVRVIAGTFEQALDSRAQWMLDAKSGVPVLRLRASPGRPHAANHASEGSWSPVEPLLGEDPLVKTHTLRRDRLSGVLRAHPVNVPAHLLNWLHRSR